MRESRPLKSDDITAGMDKSANRALLYPLGLTRGDFGKPFIAVVSSFNEILPGCMPLRALAE
jgi:dihydroxy-acid dehydratase